MLLFWSFGQLNIRLYEFYFIVNLTNVPVALETFMFMKFANYYIFVYLLLIFFIV